MQNLIFDNLVIQLSFYAFMFTEKAFYKKKFYIIKSYFQIYFIDYINFINLPQSSLELNKFFFSIVATFKMNFKIYNFFPHITYDLKNITFIQLQTNKKSQKSDYQEFHFNLFF